MTLTHQLVYWPIRRFYSCLNFQVELCFNFLGILRQENLNLPNDALTFQIKAWKPPLLLRCNFFKFCLRPKYAWNLQISSGIHLYLKSTSKICTGNDVSCDRLMNNKICTFFNCFYRVANFSRSYLEIENQQKWMMLIWEQLLM